MVSELGKGGVMIYNWPEDCRIPGSTSKEGNKGVAELHASEQIALMNAFVAVPHRLYFVLLDDEDKKMGECLLPMHSLSGPSTN